VRALAHNHPEGWKLRRHVSPAYDGLTTGATNDAVVVGGGPALGTTFPPADAWVGGGVGRSGSEEGQWEEVGRGKGRVWGEGGGAGGPGRKAGREEWASRSCGGSYRCGGLFATKWLPKWLGCEPRLIARALCLCLP